MKGKKLAYVSVYNKEKIVEFCGYLAEYGYELIATDGTYRVLTEAGIPALSAERLTGNEPTGRNVRTLYPEVYNGIIANQMTELQREEYQNKSQLFPIELVVVNLYPFKADMELGIPFEDAAEHIDAGGVAMLNAAAKNYRNTVAVCDPADYDRVLCALAAGYISDEERKYLTYKAFSCTAAYDALVAQYLAHELKINFPQTLTLTYEKAEDIGYGENPHQKAAVYRDTLLKEGSLARAKQLAGPKLTYNSINDANTALELVKEFDTPTVVACKHCVPCAVGTGENVFDAFENALEADPQGFQGVILAVNGIVDARLAERLRVLSAELVMAVGFTPEAMAELHYQENIILLEIPDIRSKLQFSTCDMQKIYGGLLAQTYDTELYREVRTVTDRPLTDAERSALLFNYKVAKHANSSAVVIGGEYATAGIGTGQSNRLLAMQFAFALAGERARGAVLVSDADITAECVERCREAGITAIAQTGNVGAEVVEACNRYGIAMVSTDMRHFKS